MKPEITDPPENRFGGANTAQPVPFLKVLNLIFILILCIFAGIFVFRNRTEIWSLFENANIGLLLLALLLHFVFVLFQGVLGVSVLRSTGASVSYSQGLPVFCLSLFGKYIPGKVWVVTSRTVFFARRNIRTTQVVAAAVQEHIFVILSGLIMALVFYPALFGKTALAASAGFLVLGAIVLVPPRKIHRLIDRVLALFRKEPLERWASRGDVLRYMFLYSANWFILGFALVLLARSMFPPIPLNIFLPWTGLYALAVSAGFLAIFAPGGIGVREGIFFLGFSTQLSTLDAGTLTIMTRVTVTLAELMVLVATMVFASFSREIHVQKPLSDGPVPENCKGLGHE
ncbi:hypothetical protein BMS3Abin14_00936 [bacterium BMS3Abin14]|nr:hypothetical protein BMS3Abin14_00936 [bacterium BMS3Abin14]